MSADAQDLFVDSDGQLSTRDETREKYNIHVGKLKFKNVQSFQANLLKIKDRVVSFSLRGTSLYASEVVQVLLPVLEFREFRQLVLLDLSGVEFSDPLLHLLCEYLNPFSGGFNITKLRLSRCELGPSKTIQLLESLYANNTIEELTLTGNNCADEGINTLMNCLTKYKNNIKILSLGGNDLTSKGVAMLCDVVRNPHQGLRELCLANNPDIGDSVIDDFFIALNQGNTIESLSMSNCGITSCEWCRYFPFLHTLRALNLSYNLIGDSEFVKLCKGLELCFSLSALDLSYNRFSGMKCRCIDLLLSTNKSVQTLVLDGNRLHDSVWDAIGNGLTNNFTLLNLSLKDCNLNISKVRSVCTALAANEICTIYLESNPLPDQLITDPREYCNNKNSLLADLNVVSLNKSAQSISIENALKWRALRANEVALSVNSIAIAAHRSQVLQAEEKIKKKQATVTAATAFATANSLIENSVSSMSSPDLLGRLEELNATTSKELNELQLLEVESPSKAVSNPKIIAQSEYYLSSAQLEEVVAQSDHANTSELRLVHVAYGRDALVIGTVQITAVTTYAEARALVAPVVQAYANTLQNDKELFQVLISKYTLMDRLRTVVSGEDSHRRRVWPEICDMAEPIIVVRPGNWVHL